MFMGGVRLPRFSFYAIKWGSQTSLWYSKEGMDIVCLEAKPSGAYFNMLDTPIVFRASHVVHSAHALPDTFAGFQRVYCVVAVDGIIWLHRCGDPAERLFM